MSGEAGVVTVSYGSEAVLDGFLASLPAASGAPLTVVVADNRPDAASRVRELADRYGVAYLPMPRNLGYGGAMNAAVRSLPASIEWVLISNPDIEIRPGAIDELIRVGESDDRIGAVGPLVETDGEVYPSARAIPSLRMGLGHALFANIWPANPWSRRYHSDNERPPRERDAGWLSGSCLLLRRKAFDELGGFDDGFFMYFEDVDLGYRLGKAGWRSRYAPSATVMHSGAHSTDEHSTRMVVVHHESAYRFLSRKYRGWYLAPVRFAVRAGLWARALLVTRVFSRR
ncbi:glycosyltransferase family 2 protein [Agreia sp. COWG]|uniref:glycosyltransferase family 2 protein n=1 Tax=Agreia sp. COWG TaxID=2773266 RepID=UPI0019283B21|nr:glycosyltransferase family 2 protein [Agreia sp. COWG]CAD5993156.1 N-acetylglucosaminyl-diphospho-decaprenol L-rhamnosyltransferase [Agreia sp. COWG]